MEVRKIPKKMVTVIEPKRSIIVDKEKYRQKRVAAYCRVSTDSDEQLNSYKTQKAVYTDMISARTDWCLVDIYADEGITGTSLKKRDEFKKLDVNVVELTYDHTEFLKVVNGYENEKEGGARCRICIAQRLDKTFEYATINNFDIVTTTLSISPHKDAEFINMLGESLQEKYGVKYLHADFKKENGYLRSIQICKENDIYRQDYCGCEFSKNKI